MKKRLDKCYQKSYINSEMRKEKETKEERMPKTKRLTPAEEGKMAARQDEYEIEDALVPKYAIQPLATAVLVKFAKGEIDMKKLAREELESRGLDINGYQL